MKPAQAEDYQNPCTFRILLPRCSIPKPSSSPERSSLPDHSVHRTSTLSPSTQLSLIYRAPPVQDPPHSLSALSLPQTSQNKDQSIACQKCENLMLIAARSRKASLMRKLIHNVLSNKLPHSNVTPSVMRRHYRANSALYSY